MPRKVISPAVYVAVSDVRAAGADSASRYDDDESGSVIVGGRSDSASGSGDASSRTSPAMNARPLGGNAMLPRPDAASTGLMASNAAAIATSPTMIVRTESVKRGKRLSYEMKMMTVDGDITSALSTNHEESSIHIEVSSGKQLRKQLSGAITERRKCYVDLSQRWDNLKSRVDARTKPIPGLLEAGGGKSITIDLSNYRPAALREGAETRLKKNLNYKDWRQAFKDVEVGLVVETLVTELERVSVNPWQMPELDLICRDQPLFAAVYPLVKCLALNAESLLRLKRLDLNRYSRSEEVCEANPPIDSARVKAYDKFIDRLAQLLEDSPSLNELGLRMNGVDSFALAVIADALSDNQVLQKLDLYGNPLCIETSEARPSRLGIRVLAKALRRQCSLKDLDLSFCGLDQRAAEILVRPLALNKHLERINLAGNPIPPEHAIFDDQRVVRIVGVKPAG